MIVDEFGNIIFHAIPMACKKFLLTDYRIGVLLLVLRGLCQILLRIQIQQFVIIFVTHWRTQTCSLKQSIATGHLWASKPGLIFSTSNSMGLHFAQSSLISFATITVASWNIAPPSRSELATCREIPTLKQLSIVVVVAI